MLQLHSQCSVLVLLGVGACAAPPVRQEPPPVLAAASEEPVTQLGLALSSDAAWLTVGTRLRRAGWLAAEFLGNDEDDYAISGAFLRMGEASEESPLSLGVGISAYAYRVDLDHDAEGGALALRGLATYEVPAAFPSRVAAEVSLAPDVSSFGDGDGLLDVSIRYELDVSDFAAAFIGYRLLEIDVEDESDQTLEEGLHFGVRLAY